MEARNMTSSAALIRSSAAVTRPRYRTTTSPSAAPHSGGCIGKFRPSRLNSMYSGASHPQHHLLYKPQVSSRRVAKSSGIRRLQSRAIAAIDGNRSNNSVAADRLFKQETGSNSTSGIGKDCNFDFVTITRRNTQLLREVNEVWQQRIGTSTYISAEKVQRLFNDLQLFPSQYEDVYEMLECAMKSSSDFTLNKFLFIVNELKKREDLGPLNSGRTSQLSPRLLEKDGGECQKRSRRMSKSYGGGCDVFLGGSCNPTTWRTDIAIPMLKRMNITFYNPQVTEWRPELLEREHHAKEKALVMFFVLDNQTRSVSALIEVAHLAGKNRTLILVIQSYTQLRQAICGETISFVEYEELRNGQEVVKEMVESLGRPVFDNICDALKCTEQMVRDSKRKMSLDNLLLHSNDKALITKMRDAFNLYADTDSGTIGVNEACEAYQLLTNRKLSISDLQRVIASQTDGVTSETLSDGGKLTFDQFCILLRQMKNYRDERGILLEESEKTTAKPVKSSLSKNGLRNYVSDIYLGGSNCRSSWREEIAIPAIQDHGLTYSMPNNCHKLSFEAEQMEKCRVLLFVITNTCRSIAAMAIAGHYVGLRRPNVVLCVQQLPDDCVISGEKLSAIALKDYNRGRMYLTDLAKRENVPVYSDISEAIQCAVRMCDTR